MYYYGDGEGINLNAIVSALTNAVDHLTERENKKIEAAKQSTKDIQPDVTKVANVISSNDMLETVAMAEKIEPEMA